MSTLNAYATLAEFKAYWQDRGGTTKTDTGDDAVIERLLRTASQLLDTKTGRHFWPSVETRYFSVPDGESIDPRRLDLDEDLLEVISVANGDGTTLPSSAYDLLPRNLTPYNGIRLKDNVPYIWVSNTTGNIHFVIAVTGIWGFHNHYPLAWLVGSTAAEDMDTSETGYDVASGAGFAIGNLIRFDNELGYLSNVVTNTLTTTRGENYSAAATHLTGINVSIWQVMEEAKNAVCEIANTAYNRRFGQSTSNTETVTPAGIVLSPKDIPSLAQEFIRSYRLYS